MCLSTVYLTKLNSVTKGDAKASGKLFGYKNYDVGSKGLYSDFGAEIKIGRWMDANEEIVSKSHINEYVSGFHIFLSPIDAANYGNPDCVYLVEFENITGIGKNSDTNLGLTVIAKRMKVIRKVS